MTFANLLSYATWYGQVTTQFLL